MPTLTPAFAAFADAARRYAAFAAAGDGERAGVALALNELAGSATFGPSLTNRRGLGWTSHGFVWSGCA